jgi:hypothetical protein
VEEFEMAAIQSCVDTISDVYGERSPEAARYERAVVREGQSDDPLDKFDLAME